MLKAFSSNISEIGMAIRKKKKSPLTVTVATHSVRVRMTQLQTCAFTLRFRNARHRPHNMTFSSRVPLSTPPHFSKSTVERRHVMSRAVVIESYEPRPQWNIFQQLPGATYCIARYAYQAIRTRLVTSDDCVMLTVTTCHQVQHGACMLPNSLTCTEIARFVIVHADSVFQATVRRRMLYFHAQWETWHSGKQATPVHWRTVLSVRTGIVCRSWTSLCLQVLAFICEGLC